jgi:hypothetical protein
VLPILVRIHLAALAVPDRLHRQDGQTSAEYALVVLGAALVAVLVGAWAQHTGKVTDLLDHLFDVIRKKVA